MKKWIVFPVVLLGACATPATNKRAPSAESNPMHAHAIDQAAPATLQDCLQAGTPTVDPTPEQIKIIYDVVGSRSHRTHHALWHATRAGETGDDQQSEITAFGPSWSQNHSYCHPVPTTDPDSNPVGEDFLYMHREMIGSVRTALLSAQRMCIEAWTEVPDTKQAPLPDPDGSIAKSDGWLAQLKSWDSKFHDPSWLKTVSLSQLGVALEITTHNNLHMRYATTNPPAGFAELAAIGGVPVPYDGVYPVGFDKYDDAKYNWLADPYGAAINPIFWKIHGYVDHIIDLWLQANGYNSIAVKGQCFDKPSPCYEWHGTWTGSIPAWVDQKSQMLAKGARVAGALDGATLKFNRERMLKQWIGVPRGMKSPIRPGAPRTPDDPFQYAMHELCESN